MEEKDLKAEEKIMEAAVQEFIQKGRSGARMQEIADKAGINKALLHYYYRSKDKLFESVFTLMIKRLLLSKIKKIIEQENDIFGLIRSFTDMYVDVLNKNPNIPFFILDEIHKNPERLTAVFLNAGLPLNRVFEMIHQASEQGLIRPVDPRQIIVNMISLSVFPVVGRNIILPVIFQNDKDSFEKFLESRKTEVADFIIHSIKQPKD